MVSLSDPPLGLRLGSKNNLLYVLVKAKRHTHLLVYNADDLECLHEVENLDRGFSDLFVRSPVYQEFVAKKLVVLFKVSEQQLKDFRRFDPESTAEAEDPNFCRRL